MLYLIIISWYNSSKRVRVCNHSNVTIYIGRSAFKILAGRPTGRRPLGRPRRRWEDNIRMDL